MKQFVPKANKQYTQEDKHYNTKYGNNNAEYSLCEAVFMYCFKGWNKQNDTPQETNCCDNAHKHTFVNSNKITKYYRKVGTNNIRYKRIGGTAGYFLKFSLTVKQGGNTPVNSTKCNEYKQ